MKNDLRTIHQLGKKLEEQPSVNDEHLEQFILSLTSYAQSNPAANYFDTIAKKLRISTLTPKLLHDIMMAIERELDISSIENEFLINQPDNKSQPHEKTELVVIIDSLRSAFNIGSIFRTVDCINAKKILTCGYSANPESAKLRKSAMGTEEWVEWQHYDDSASAIIDLKNENYEIVALETSTDSISLFDFEMPKKIAVICGNERFGLSPSTLKECHYKVHIPVYGRKNSLNVANAFAIFGYFYNRSIIG